MPYAQVTLFTLFTPWLSTTWTFIIIILLHYKGLELTTLFFQYREVLDKEVLTKINLFGFVKYRPLKILA